MKITVNGEPVELEGSVSLALLLQKRSHAPALVAVAVNREFVPRSEHEARKVREGDAVEILSPQQGG